MSAKLYFSNSPAVLLDKLSQNLEWADPLLSPHIATPTPAMKRWVQMRLADKLGIVANVRFLHLEQTLWRRLEELDQEHVVEDRKPARLLDEQGLQLLILGLLRLRPPAEVRAYLEETGEARRSGASGEALLSRRLCQLSSKLAGFFREYEYSRVHEPGGRQGLAHLWKHGEDCFAAYLRKRDAKETRAQVGKLERWQKAVYHALFKPEGLRDQVGAGSGQYSYTLPQYAEMVLSQRQARADAAGHPPSYHLFGLSQVSPFHQSLIHRLSDNEALRGHHAVFHIYSLNPCGEYWEDVSTARERRRLIQEDMFRRQRYVSWRQLEADEKTRLLGELEALQAEELHLDEENPLLSQWGAPGRNNIRLWSRYSEYDFYDHFQEMGSRSLLSALQDAVLKRRGRLSPEERVPQDGSLRIFACPEIHREVETVHQAIVEDLLNDPALRPDEVAVLVPDMEKYRHVLAAVFDRTAPGEPGHVPHSLGDGSTSAESEYARGVRSLFALARGRFSRKEVFALAANPCFRHGLGLDEENLRSWIRWSEALNIFHGYDGEDKRSRGYAADPAHTWSQGLDRLVLGTVMECPAPEDGRHFHGLVPFADGRGQDRELLEAFVLVIQGLHRGLRPLRAGLRPWGEWLDMLSELLDAYLTVPDDEPLETYVRSELRRYLPELRGMDGLEALLERGGGSAPGVSAGIPMDLILERLDGLKAGRETQGFGGVQIASLQTLRSLPFRAVYIVGLGEGKFPEDAATSTLDLRQYRRVIGDVDPAARNRYLFLEALVCAGEKLCLSYLSRDVQQGKTFQMSSVLNELVDYLEDGILPAEGGRPGRFRAVPVPLLSRAPSLFASAEARPWDPPRNFSHEERLLSWLEAKRKAYGEAGGVDFPGLLRAGLPERLRRDIFPAPPAPGAASQAAVRPAAVKVPLKDLQGYLKNPVEYALYRHLGVNDWREEDPSDREDEPFFSGKAREKELLERAFAARLRDLGAPLSAGIRRGFDDYYHALSQRGFMPEGHYQTLDRELLWTGAEQALQALDGAIESIRKFGPTENLIPAALGGEGPVSGPEAAAVFPPVRIDGLACLQGGAAELHGALPCLFRVPGNGCATLVAMPYQLRLDRLLSPFLFYLAGLLSDSRIGEWLRSGPFTIHYLHRQGEGFAVQAWPAFDCAPDRARDYLRNLLESMLPGRDFDHLPFDLVKDALVEKTGPRNRKWEGRLIADADYARILRDALEDLDPGDEFAAYRPRESVRILGPAVPDDAFAKLQARLGPFFNWT